MNNRLYRSTSEQVLGGVAAGIARHLNVDPMIVRLGFIVGALFTHGALLLVYLVLWAVLPTVASTATSTGEVVRENVNEVAARFGMSAPPAPRTDAPPATSAPASAPATPTTAPATAAFNAQGLVRMLVLAGVAFLILRSMGPGWMMVGHHMSGGFFLPLLLLFGAFAWFRRCRA